MKKDKKNEIFDAMDQLMTEMAYKDISVELIAKKANIGKGSIYYYFNSKEEILYGAIERSCRRAVHEYFVSIGTQSETSALEKIKKLFQSVIKRDFSGNEKNMIPMISRHDDLAIHHIMKSAAVQEISPVLEELLREGISEGSIKTETPKESAEMIVAVLTFFLDEDVFPGNAKSMKNRLKILARVLETSLQTGKGSFDFICGSSFAE